MAVSLTGTMQFSCPFAVLILASTVQTFPDSSAEFPASLTADARLPKCRLFCPSPKHRISRGGKAKTKRTDVPEGRRRKQRVIVEKNAKQKRSETKM